VTCGFTGGLYAGLLTASVILNRNLFTDCQTLRDQIYAGVPDYTPINTDGSIFTNDSSKQQNGSGKQQNGSGKQQNGSGKQNGSVMKNGASSSNGT